mgnify:CR=1 FL=1
MPVCIFTKPSMSVCISLTRRFFRSLVASTLMSGRISVCSSDTAIFLLLPILRPLFPDNTNNFSVSSEILYAEANPGNLFLEILLVPFSMFEIREVPHPIASAIFRWVKLIFIRCWTRNARTSSGVFGSVDFSLLSINPSFIELSGIDDI